MAKKEFNSMEEITNICNWIKNYFVEEANATSKAIIGISGGKDSTIAAALLVRALGPERVLGVLMPQGVQPDIDDARAICDRLGIDYVEIDIGTACSALYRSIDEAWDFDHQCEKLPIVGTNTPARIRMTTLYAMAGIVGGRVCNTCNWSEDYIGYSTKYGDCAGDFAILSKYTVSEVLQIGKMLSTLMDIPEFFIYKAPSDGMCGTTDEDNLGFTYETLDKFLLEGIIPDYPIYRNIQQRHKRNLHKTNCIHLPAPQPLAYRRYMGYEGGPFEF